MSIKNLFSKHIKNSPYKVEVALSRICVGKLRQDLRDVTGGDHYIIYINSRSLKHIYDRHIFDKKVPKDFYLILKNLNKILLDPDRIYKDKEGKRGNYIFVKVIVNKTYMCTVEMISSGEIEVVSSLTGKKYLSKFVLLWSWGPANSPS